MPLAVWDYGEDEGTDFLYSKATRSKSATSPPMWPIYQINRNSSNHACSVRCPACANLSLTEQGLLPELRPRIFGGVEVDTVLEAGHLFHCLCCDLYFRHPYPSQLALTKLYEGLPPTVWEWSEPPPYWPLLLELIQRYSANRKILDVGCFRGDFLAWLPGDWHKMGIEPNMTARQFALRRGIQLMGDTVKCLHPMPDSVGVITLLDLLEHIVDPLTLLGDLKKLLAPHGSIVVLTGAADTLPWRIFGCDYWYCALPEHVSFFTLKWFRWVAGQLGLSIAWFRYLSSKQGDAKQSFFNFSRLSAYVFVRRLRRFGVPNHLLARTPFIRRVARWTSPPWWREAKDHILIVLKAS